MKLSKALAWVFACLLALAGRAAFAQTLETFEWVEGGPAVVARITFAANVRFIFQAPANTVPTDLAQLSFQIIAADESVLGQTIEEGRRLDPRAGRPRIDLSYSPTPRAPARILNLRFSQKVLLQVRQGPGGRTIDLVLSDVANGEAASLSTLPQPAAAPGERLYLVRLQSTPADKTAQIRSVPRAFQDYEVFTRNTDQDGVKFMDLLTGYFKTEQEAETVRQFALTNFPQAKVLSVASLQTQAVTPVAPMSPAPSPPVREPSPPPGAVAAAPVAQPQVAINVSDADAQGADLLAKTQLAMHEQRYQDAVATANQALMLPPNAATPATQFLIGEAWLALGQLDKARTEYRLYSKLYPEGADMTRVTQRLAGLGDAAAPITAGAPDLQVEKKRLSATGSISQYYYGGQTKTDSLVNIATGIDQSTLTRTNQSVLVSSWDATGRYETDESVTKLVMRGSHSDNLAPDSSLSSTTDGLISAAYVDYHDNKSRMDVRIGRQSAIGGSLFGLFDGVSMAMPVGESYKLDAMAGVPANALVTAPSQVMAGVMLEGDNLFQHWGGNVSLVEMTTEGISDRRAIGTEVRYFGDSLSVFTQLDYDINFNTMNAFTVQGSFQGPYDTTVTMLLDDRRAPSLQLSDALIASGATSLKTLLQLNSLDTVQGLALATSAEAKQASVSLSRALSPKWQGSVDLRYSDVGALPAVGNFQAQPATGAQYNVSFQLTGSNLYSNRDINGFNVSFLNSDTLNGTQLAYNNLTGFLDNKLSVEPSIRYYTQIDNTQTTITRISPGMRVSYKLSNRASLMAEGVYETSTTDGPTNHETSDSMFFYFGYRYDFQ